MENTIEIKTKDGTFEAYMSKPKNQSAPVIICLQEIFGVNVWMKNIADDLASKGFVAIVPDLFWRIEPGIEINSESKEDFDKAFELYGKFDADKGMNDINASIIHARGMDINSNNKVGTIGFCLGGYLSYRSAIETDADVNISYYGVGIETELSKKNNIRQGLMLHMASKDQFVSENIQQNIEQELSDLEEVVIYKYDEDHAFARKGGDSYKKESAILAEKRSIDFLSQYLT